MAMQLQARYLEIEWQELGRARSVTVAPEPIEVDEQPDGTWVAETQVFHGLCPWVGLHLEGSLAHTQPTFEGTDGRHEPMLRISDSQSRHWWVQEHGWDDTRKRHLSELHRSMGQFTIWLGGQRLQLNNVVDELDRTSVEDYLRDFQQDLIWLVMGFGGATATTGSGATVNKGIVDALEAFATASRRVLTHPAQHVREVLIESRLARLRPNVGTFREYLRNPSAQRLTGRGAEETPDIADNRYLRHMVQVCEKLALHVAKAAELHARLFADRARVESQRSIDYQTTTHREVNAEVFDRQMRDLEKKLARVTEFSTDSPRQDEEHRVFEFRPGGPYGKRSGQMFYNNKDGSPSADKALDVNYSVLEVPSQLAEAIQTTQSFCDYYQIKGVARATRRETKKGKGYREVVFSKIYGVTPFTSAITNKSAKRQKLERDNWLSPLTLKERQELKQEGITAQKRERVYREQGQRVEQLTKLLKQCQAELRAQNLEWQQLGVASSSQVPMGVRFSQSPDYTACQVSYTKVTTLASNHGFGLDEIEAIDRIGVLHASALYERWCLVKIMSILMEDYKFKPEIGWQEQLIRAVTGKPQSLTLKFRRDDMAWSACLEVQPELPNGRRPDFRLRFKQDDPGSANHLVGGGDGGVPFQPVSRRRALHDGLVMDAKFRTQWRRGELGRALTSLVQEKEYGQEGDRVFILHPAPRSILKPSSPLIWKKDCDYGQEGQIAHRKGVIYLAPGTGETSPEYNLRRLIVLLLQASFPAPHQVENGGIKMWEGHGFCVRCGQAHQPGDTERHLTGRKNEFWTLTCAECGMHVTRTHCYGCDKGILFKNGLQLTYHKTVADQVTNIVCPCCGSYFDSDVHGKYASY